MKKEDFITGWFFRKAGDSEWKSVMIPHDAMQGEKRSADCESGSAGAYYPGGRYEYKKSFEVPAEWKDRHIAFLFEGVYRNSEVYINGKKAGGAAYGYIPFWVIADGYLNYGEINDISVISDNSSQPDSRWYTGSGIYRPVWLWTSGKEYIIPESVRVSTLSYKPAKIRVEAGVGGNAAGQLKVEIMDNGKVILSGNLKETENSCEFEIPDARLWSDKNPYLYQCRVSIMGNGNSVIDEDTVSFGIRKIEWSNKGLMINGKKTLLRGGCLHHDNGILGAATYDESERRRIKILKEAGYNAVRSSHNPASRAMLEACDELGMYMMDETWDMWYSKKSKYDYADYFMDNYKNDIAALVARDYNHPSVIMYSIGNEVSEPATDKGVKLASTMTGLFHKLDGTRPVTGGMNLMIIKQSAGGKGIYKEDGSGADTKEQEKKMQGMNSTMFNMITSMVGSGMNKAANGKKADAVTTPVLDTLDIAGYNYASGRYPLEGKAHPDRVIFGSETFPQDIAKNWEMVEKYPYLIGDFMWTAWDYLGEAGIGAWAYTPDGKGFNKPYPWLLGDVGAFDICGNPNGEVFWAQAVWGILGKPMLAVQPINHDMKPAKGAWRGTNAIPCWSFKGCEGKNALVEVYFKAAEAELFLNDKSLGKKKLKDCRAVFKVKYQPGTLEAVVFDNNGRELGRNNLKTVSGANLLTLEPEKTKCGAGEIVYVRVALADKNGVVEGNDDRLIKLSAEGGELLAFGSANPRTEECFNAGQYTTYYGRALAAVRAGKSGKLVISAQDNGNVVRKEIEIV